MVKRISHESGSKDVDAYIAKCPKNVQGKLKEIRTAIRKVSPGATENISYRMPGYSYAGYDYKGMYAWFGLQSSHIGLYLRPPTIQHHKKELEGFVTTKSAIHFPLDNKIPVPLLKKLVKASVKIMKARSAKSERE